jgi:hypothetical protein
MSPKWSFIAMGMSDDVAFHVEAALIDTYPDLANIVLGRGSGKFGPLSTNELEESYALTPTPLETGLKYLLVFINRKWHPTMTADQSYRAAHYAWGVNRDKAHNCDYVLAIGPGGIVRGCFVADHWHAATLENFPEYDPIRGRSGFRGMPASEDIWNRYVPSQLPDEVLPQGKGPTSFCYWPRDRPTA